MKKNRRWLPVFASILMLSVPLFLSACGKEGETAEGTGCFSELDKRVVETVVENSDFAILVTEGNIEPVIDKIHYGVFSDEAEKPKEIFVDCRLKGMPHAGGLDTRAGILLDADTLELIAYKEFDGDGVMLHCLQTAGGQSRILSLRTSAGTGNRGQWFELWGVRDGEWEELPTGIEELIPEEKKGDIAVGMNGPERRIEDSFCYLSGENRLVVTYEQDWTADAVPSELVAILEWDPSQERFVLDGHTGQPAEKPNLLSKLERLAAEAVTENSEIYGSMVERGEIEVAIDKIHWGVFSEEALLHPENANEIFLDCRLMDLPHVGGLDTRAGILLNADTLELTAYRDFIGDQVLLHCLQTARGQNRILALCTVAGTGNRGQWFELWGVRDGQWEELPTGIEELIPEEYKEAVTGVNGTEAKARDSFCYIAGGGRLAVTYEKSGMDSFFNGGVPSKLTAILVWNPRQERFELANDGTKQPAVGQN